MEKTPNNINKPELTYRQRQGQWGEIIIELDPESEQAYNRYLTEQNLARKAILLEKLEDTEEN